MSKKIMVLIVIAALAAISAGFIAVESVLAQDSSGWLQRLRRPHGVLGQVSEVQNNEVTIQKQDGSVVTFLVDDDTKFVDQDRNELSLAELVEDGWIVATFGPRQPEANQKPLARLVVILPADFDPEKMSGYRGVIAGVNVDAGEITIQTRDQQEVTIQVGEDTNFFGQASDLGSLEEEMLAQVMAETLADGSLLAQSVRSSYPAARKVGQIVAIDPAARTFTVKSRDGILTTFSVNDETRYRSKGDQLNRLDDLEVGMVGATAAVYDPAYPNPLVKMIIAVDREDLPRGGERFAGKVVSVDRQSFTIETRRGEQITFQVDENTRFRSLGGQVTELSDLQNGMILVVNAKKMDNGEYLALLVASQRPPAP
jgi:preprotein translocase subunit YajC